MALNRYSCDRCAYSTCIATGDGGGPIEYAAVACDSCHELVRVAVRISRPTQADLSSVRFEHCPECDRALPRPDLTAALEEFQRLDNSQVEELAAEVMRLMRMPCPREGCDGQLAAALEGYWTASTEFF